MYTFLSIVYVLVCLFLILVVLLQPGRGGVGGAFGGGSSQTVFGGSGAGNFLTRLTSISAALFMILSATLAYMSSSSDKSLEAATEAARAKAALKAKNSADAGVAPAQSTPVQVDMQQAPASEPSEKAPSAPEAPTLERIVPPANQPASAPSK
jgi:preprotein translocase subunit SecG